MNSRRNLLTNHSPLIPPDSYKISLIIQFAPSQNVPIFWSFRQVDPILHESRWRLVMLYQGHKASQLQNRLSLRAANSPSPLSPLGHTASLTELKTDYNKRFYHKSLILPFTTSDCLYKYNTEKNWFGIHLWYFSLQWSSKECDWKAQSQLIDQTNVCVFKLLS